MTVAANAISYSMSALCVTRIRATDISTVPGADPRVRTVDLWIGLQLIYRGHVLRRLFLNSVLVSGLILATGPILAVLLLGEYHFPAWQYRLAFGVPALGGSLGARLAPRLVHRFRADRVLLVSGWLRSIFPIGLAFVQPGVTGLLTVIVVEGLLITCMGVFNPI